MSGIGDMVVNLKANTANLSKGLASGAGGIKSFASSAVSFLNPVTAAFTAVAASAVGVGVAIWGLQDRIGTLAGVADKALQTGLSGKFLQQLEYAADQSGVSAEALTGAIKKLTIATGAGSKAFDEIGLNLADLKAKSPEQQFLTVADAISKLPTAADRAAAAVKVFGKSGIEITGLFAGGLADINKLMTEAQALGIGVSEEGLRKAAEADDAIQRMKAAFSALIDQVAVGVAPAFKMIADEITAWIPPITKFFESFNALDDKAKFIGDVFEASMSVAYERMKLGFDDLLAAMVQKAGVAGVEIAKRISGVDFIEQAVGLGQAAAGVVNQEGGLEAAQKRLAGVLEQLKPVAQAAPVAAAEKPKLQTLEDRMQQMDAGGSLFDRLAGAASSKLSDLKIKGGFLGSIVENMFTGKSPDGKPVQPKEEAARRIEPQLAGAMQKGSAEAYSTIVNAALRSKDPNVKATEKQTQVLVKAMKDNRPKFQMVGAFT